MSYWYERLESQLKWQHYTELMKVVQPSAEDWRSLGVVSGERLTLRKLASTNSTKEKK